MRLEATNRDGKPRAPASKFKLLDEAGNEYEMLAASRREALKRKLNPGVSTAVTLIYEVAEGEQHTYYLRVTSDKGFWHQKKAALIRLDPQGPEPVGGEGHGTGLH